MSQRLVARVLFAAVALQSTVAFAGTGTPELDASSLPAGLGVASALVMWLSHRGTTARQDDADAE
jgi:hypothetical protein